MNVTSVVMSLAEEYSRKCHKILQFSSPETLQGKLQTYALLAMYFRKEGNLTSSDQFLL